jgi:hypothetical protein
MDRFKNFISQYQTEFDDYFNQTDILAIIELDNDLKIEKHNGCFKNLISSESDLCGDEICSFLLPESYEYFPLPQSLDSLIVWLNFKSIDGSALPLHCQIFRIANGKHLIIGGHLTLTNNKIIENMTVMSNEMANMVRDIHKKNRELEAAHLKINVLGGIIPICMHCKEIRDDKGYWNQLEKFITEHSEAQFSHGICDKCLKEHYPDD